MYPQHIDRKHFVLLADRSLHDCLEEAVLCRSRVCDRTPHILGNAAVGGQRSHIRGGEKRESHADDMQERFSDRDSNRG